MKLHPVDAERAPSHPCGPIETRRLLNLARMKDLKQCRVYDQGLRIAHQLGHDSTSKRLQVASEPAYAAMQRGRPKPYDPREEVREEPSDLAQEGAFGFYPSELW